VCRTSKPLPYATDEPPACAPASPGIVPVGDILDMEDDTLGLMGFEDFDFSMDFQMMNPVPVSSALSF